MGSRQVGDARAARERRRRANLALGVLLVGAVVTGVGANTIGVDWPVDLIAVHAALALAILVLSPWKSAVVLLGLRRRRSPSRLDVGKAASLVLLGMVLVALVSGLAHATGLVDMVWRLTVMQVHVGAGVVAVLLVVGHVRRHPVRPRRVDRERRALLAAGGVVAAGAVLWGGWERALAATGAPGGDRRFTGSVEKASGRPRQMPVYAWIDDATPALDAQVWRLRVAGRRLALSDLASLEQDDVDAVLDCTGGWYSRQRWTGVRLDRLMGELPEGTRSVEVRSATGYARWIPVGDLAAVWLVTHVGGEPLSPGHGFPARLVAPDRRAFWWVKWVVSVTPSTRPGWAQSPFPLT